MSETTTNEYRKIARELVEIGQGVFSIHETLNPNNGYSVEVSKMACMTLVKDIADLRKRCEEIAEQREGKVVIKADTDITDFGRIVELAGHYHCSNLDEVPGGPRCREHTFYRVTHAPVHDAYNADCKCCWNLWLDRCKKEQEVPGHIPPLKPGENYKP